MQKFNGMASLIQHVRRQVVLEPGASTAATISRYAAAFNALRRRTESGALTFFVFHADVPASHRAIDYVDVKHDHWDFDYTALGRHLLWAVLRFNHKAHIYYVTDESTPPLLVHPSVTMVRLPLDNRAPVYERVKAMAGYVHSEAFVANTIFLDTDAYPNRPLDSVFNKDFDVGVTYRTTPGFMPINEGVIFCSARNPMAARAFFAAYLGTYEELRRDPSVLNYYGNDIDRWRGGQLSLNAVALPDAPLGTPDFTSSIARIRMFPCGDFNYWVTRERRSGSRTWDRKFVLHLKGDSKRFLADVAQYQLNRRTRNAESGKWLVPNVVA